MAESWPYILGMLGLLLASGFFSGSEAAFFSLTPSQRRGLANGSAVDRMASRLLGKSERLMMAILFWNLAINIFFFTVASKLAIEASRLGTWEALPAAITVIALLLMVMGGEFLPKTAAVTRPLLFVRLVVVPLGVAVRAIDVVLPLVRMVNEYSRRLVWPGFRAEQYLELADLDRAIELSTHDARLFEQEQQVLRNIIRLSEIKAVEWMRPRTQYVVFTPPLSLGQLGGLKTPSGYMLVTNDDGTDIVSYVNISALRPGGDFDLNLLKRNPVVVPWCATIASALSSLRDAERRVALVVNEFGETIGVLTWEEIIEAILQSSKAPSLRELAKAEIRPVSDSLWLATGMTKLRRLENVVGIRLASARGRTIAGVLQEQLHRLPEEGDECTLEGLSFRVVQAAARGEILVQVTKLPNLEENQDGG